MNKILLFISLSFSHFLFGQNLIETINSGGISSENANVSIGEILIIPENENAQSPTGVLGLISQISNLEVDELELSKELIVYPNPTTYQLFFKTNEKLLNETVIIYDLLGKELAQKAIGLNNSIDLSELNQGVYLIKFRNLKTKTFKIIKK